MKKKYITPRVEVEELSKVDVLCNSREDDFNTPDNGQQSLLNFPSWWD